MDGVDPLSRQVGQSHEVGLAGQHFGLEPSHLAGGGRFLGHRPAADDPAHRRIMAEAVGVVDILVPGKATEHRLPELCRQGVAVVLAGPAVGQHLPGHLGQAEGVIQFAKGEQPGVRGHLRSVELQFEAAVEGDPQIARFQFTRHQIHAQSLQQPTTH
jgi:hypothetical protein